MDMPPFNNRQSPDDPTIKQWFENIEAGTPHVVAPSPPASDPNKKRRLLIIVLAVVFVFAAAAAAYSTFGLQLFSTAPACLTANDYKLLSGHTADEQFSPQAFYTVSFDYTNATANFTADSKTNAQSEVKKIAQFYKKYAKDRSIVVTISSDVNSNDTEQAASDRIAELKSMLLKQGVLESSLQIVQPADVSSDGELSDDSSELLTSKAYINVASIADCR